MMQSCLQYFISQIENSLFNHGFHNDTTPRYDEAAATLAVAVAVLLPVDEQPEDFLRLSPDRPRLGGRRVELDGGERRLTAPLVVER